MAPELKDNPSLVIIKAVADKYPGIKIGATFDPRPDDGSRYADIRGRYSATGTRNRATGRFDGPIRPIAQR